MHPVGGTKTPGLGAALLDNPSWRMGCDCFDIGDQPQTCNSSSELGLNVT
jgi:hypothetical protein